MTWAELVVILAAMLTITCAAVCHLATKTCADAADLVVDRLNAWNDARAEHSEHDRKSLACWLEISAATKEGRPVAEWAWAWANGIDEDA